MVFSNFEITDFCFNCEEYKVYFIKIKWKLFIVEISSDFVSIREDKKSL